KGHAALHCNGKGGGQEKGRPVKQSPFIQYDPFNNPNPNNSYSNIDRAKQAKLNSIKATNAKRVKEIKAKAARDLSNLKAQMTLARNALGMTVTVPLSDDSSDECKDDSNPRTKAENEFAKSLNITTNDSKRGRQNRKRKVTDAFADVNIDGLSNNTKKRKKHTPNTRPRASKSSKSNSKSKPTLKNGAIKQAQITSLNTKIGDLLSAKTFIAKNGAFSDVNLCKNFGLPHGTVSNVSLKYGLPHDAGPRPHSESDE
ncbi:MAG: hypothetical protein GY928_39035, partial [Colwellia sp.]|nr:hypothetical protein [Colwellia sp.]